MLSITEFKQSVRSFSLCEPLDYIIYRPIAYILVKLTYFLPLTPNSISVVGLICSLYAGYSISLGTPEGFFTGGIFTFLFCTVDCADGMLARMKKNGSPLGEVVDMLVDALSSIAIFTGLFIALKNIGGDFPPLIAYLSALFLLVHVVIYNYYKKQLGFYLAGRPSGRVDEIKKYRDYKKRLRTEGGQYFSRFLVSSLLLFFRFQKSEKENCLIYNVNNYVINGKKMLPVWGVISGSSHLSILLLSLLLNQIGFYFLFALIFANAWMLFSVALQKFYNTKTKAAV